MLQAFDAPLLRDVASNQNGREIAKVAGEHRVQYGVREQCMSSSEWPQEAVEQRLVIADETTVQRPAENPFTLREYHAMAKKIMPRLRQRNEKAEPRFDERKTTAEV